MWPSADFGGIPSRFGTDQYCIVAEICLRFVRFWRVTDYAEVTVSDITEHEQRCIHYAPSFLVASLFTVCHHLGWITEILLRLNHRQGVAEPFVLNDGR